MFGEMLPHLLVVRRTRDFRKKVTVQCGTDRDEQLPAIMQIAYYLIQKQVQRRNAGDKHLPVATRVRRPSESMNKTKGVYQACIEQKPVRVTSVRLSPSSLSTLIDQYCRTPKQRPSNFYGLTENPLPKTVLVALVCTYVTVNVAHQRPSVS